MTWFSRRQLAVFIVLTVYVLIPGGANVLVTFIHESLFITVMFVVDLNIFP